MPTPTYDLIASNVLSSSASSVTFSSIPATYRDLVLVVTTRSSSGSGRNLLLRLNNDSSSSYAWVNARGNGTSTGTDASTRVGSIPIGNFGMSDTTLGVTIMQIMDYSATDKHKTVLARFNDASTETVMTAGRWPSTSAVNEVAALTTSGEFASGSTFYLYGIVS